MSSAVFVTSFINDYRRHESDDIYFLINYLTPSRNHVRRCFRNTKNICTPIVKSQEIAHM